MEQTPQIKRNLFLNISTFVGIMISLFFILYGIQMHLFTSKAALESFLQHFGFWGPIIFMLFQMIQVIIPIAPGGISGVVGIIAFGPLKGFIYSYTGVCIGSIMVFLLARRYGIAFVQNMSSKKAFGKYAVWLQKPGFDKFFAIAIFSPIAPDDLLCYLAGASKIKLRKFVVIILSGKLLSIAAYSFGLNFVFQKLVQLF